MRASITVASIGLGAALLLWAPQPSLGIGLGDPDGAGHPNVGLLAFDLDGPGGPFPPIAFCTGFVVSDSIFVTAAHCIAAVPAPSWAVTLDTGPVAASGVYPDDFPFFVIVSVDYATEVVPHPRFGEGGPRANDIAVLTFPAGTFSSITPVELPGERALDALAAGGGLLGQDFTLVGYGGIPFARSNKQFFVDGSRMVASAPFQALTPESLVLQMTPEATGAGFTCFGDSGGPQFLGASNLAMSLVGSGHDGGPCGSGADFLQRLDTPVVREFLADYVDLP